MALANVRTNEQISTLIATALTAPIFGILTIIILYSDNHPASIYAKILMWVFLTVCCGVSALPLYWMRENIRALYGAFELVFATVTLVFAVAGIGHIVMKNIVGEIGVNIVMGMMTFGASGQIDVPLNPDDIAKLFSLFFQVVASLYVMVRGFDNIGQGLKAYQKYDRIWRMISMRPYASPKPAQVAPNSTTLPLPWGNMTVRIDH